MTDDQARTYLDPLLTTIGEFYQANYLELGQSKHVWADNLLCHLRAKGYRVLAR